MFFFLFFVLLYGKKVIDDLLGKQFYVSLKLAGFSVTFLLKFSHAVVFSHFIFNSKYSDWFKFHSPRFFMLGMYNLVIKGFITRVLNGWSGVIVG